MDAPLETEKKVPTKRAVRRRARSKTRTEVANVAASKQTPGNFSGGNFVIVADEVGVTINLNF